MKKNRKTISIKISALLIMIISISACGQKAPTPTPKQQGATQEQKDEKIPKQLKSIESDIEKMVKEMKGPAVILEEDKEDGKKEDGQQAKQQDQDGGKQSAGGSEQQKQQGSGQGGQQGQSKQGEEKKPEEPSPKPKPEDPWEKTTKLVNSLHYKWNSYMPEAGKKGASKMLMDNFGNSLNDLTTVISKKNQTQTQLALSELYSFIPDFYSLYKTKNSPEIKRIRHYTRNAILYSMTGEWVKVDSAVSSLKSSWSLYKNTLDKEQETTSNKLDYSIYELEKVTGSKNHKLIDIKGKVTMANIENLEKAQQKKNQMDQITQ